ncbi:MAG: histone deacetylase [Thermomicrobiaceae bacterium]
MSMQDVTALVFSDYSAGHDTGSHPENQQRLTAVRERLSDEGLLTDRPMYLSDPVDADVPLLAHDQSLIDRVRELSESGGGFIDGDTLVASGSWEAALASVGAGIRAVDLVLAGEHKRAFSMARPPGHHAERHRQLGFCLFNNIAIAALHAIQHHNVNRVAIVDWDVHHGNGTQDIFYESDQVLFCSVHQWPLFPGSGLDTETGSGPGTGLTVNVPLPAGSTDNDYISVMDEIVAPAIRNFQPELLMISAGFDAHRDDPLANMLVSEGGFGQMADRALAWAHELTEGQLVLMLEGGYNLRALSESVVAVLHALDRTAPRERGTR